MGRRIAMTVLGLVAASCATARTDFQPYSASSERAPVLDRAIEARQQDLPALAAAGAVIVGTVTTRGNGFAGPEHVIDEAAREAARHGGTHIVPGMSVHRSAHGQRLQATDGEAVQGKAAGAYYPGRTVQLTALVLRLPEEVSWVQLPAPLRPVPDVHVARGAWPRPPSARATREARPAPHPAAHDAATALAPLPPSEAPGLSGGEALMIDGSHIQPLPAARD